MPGLEWRFLDKSHKTQLQNFCCCAGDVRVPGRSKKVRRTPEFEREVQTSLRSFRLHTPGGVPLEWLAGFSGNSLVSVAVFRPVELGESPFYYVRDLAVARSFQRRGYGVETLLQLQEEVVSRAIPTRARTVRLEAMVHPENVRARLMNARAGFRHEPDADEEGLESWQLSLPVPHDADFELG